jgi:protocatechuate 3,4-dioxygenase beta subunit
METYSIADLDRRDLLKMSAVIAGLGAVTASRDARAAPAELQITPAQTLGPVYPLKELPQTADLTRIPGRPGRAEGQVLNVVGQVLNLAGEPVRNAKVEVWQANARGRYTHPSDRNPAPLDPNFDGAAILVTDGEGRYRFKTIKPGAYPVGANLMRPAHIHFQVSGKQDRLVTQMYFEGDPYNRSDPLLNSAPPERKELLIVKLLDETPELEPGSKLVKFNIVVFTG